MATYTAARWGVETPASPLVDYPVFRLRGKLVGSQARELQTDLDRLRAHGTRGVVLDMFGLSSIDSFGIAIIRMAAEEGLDIVLQQVRYPVRGMLADAGAAKVLELVRT